MKNFLVALALFLLPCAASAQQTNMYWQTSGTTPCPSCWSPVSAANPLPVTGALSIAGTTSNASSGVATSATNLPTVSYNYGFNGTTWDQISTITVGSKHSVTTAIVDASGNQITTFGGAATTSNASSGVATSSTNQANVVWLYGFNGTTWDQLQVDGSKNLKITTQTAEVAGENHVGEVGGNLLPITNDMTTSAATVTTGQSIGGIQTLANAVRVSGALGASGTSGYIQSLTVTFTDAVGSGPLDVYFYNATVTTGTNCQNATAFVLQNGDRDKVLGIAHVTDFTSSNTAVVAQASNLAIPFGLSSSTSLFACVVARASFVIASTANASLKVNVVRN
jgi:hypothetical protein